ncbi:SIMPL domain-containing protein [Roseobacter sp.]|uniref:SIMPL domain-containing protein n=1 Tax=Roseobacter sp. TaxID=1907202 RepID=UPI003299E1E6
MHKILKLALALTMIAGLAVAQDTRGITTTGVGSVDSLPDMATIRLGVTHQAADAARAMAATSEGVRAVLDRLQAAGVAPRDMQTDQLALQPVWSNSNTVPRQITGFQARNTLTVRVRDMNALGGVLDLVVQGGANTFSGLSFGLQDPKPAQDAARAAAVEDAIDRARQLADAAGVSLGPVQSISEHGGGARPQMMEMTARSVSDIPVAAGELTVSAQVTIVFAIVE